MRGCLLGIPPEGYIGNERGIPIEDVKRKTLEHLAWGDASENAANEHLESSASSPGMGKTCFGFVGQETGWWHRAQCLEWISPISTEGKK